MTGEILQATVSILQVAMLEILTGLLSLAV